VKIIDEDRCGGALGDLVAVFIKEGISLPENDGLIRGDMGEVAGWGSRGKICWLEGSD
jgi:hypothetical protein